MNATNRYTLHATVGERLIDIGWGSARYVRCMIYRVLDSDTGEWVHTGSRKSDAVRVMRDLRKVDAARTPV